MARKIIYPLVAVLGIAAASGAAWWYQGQAKGPKEISGSGTAASPPSPGASAPSAPRAAGVEIGRVEKMLLQDDAQTVGTLRSRQSVMLRPEVPGRIKVLGFSDGAKVRRGQMLVQLDDALQRAEVRQGMAQVSIAKANLKRNQELVAQNFVAQRVLEESAASLQVAEAQLALSCARLARMVLLAPFDGTVGIRMVNLGDFVKDGADLVNLEDISSMYVDFRLPERFQGKLRLQQSVELALDAMPGRAFKARIEALDPLLDANGRSVGVRAVLPNTMGEAAQPAGGRPGGAAGGAPGAASGAASGAGGPGGAAAGKAGGPPMAGGPPSAKPAVRPKPAAPAGPDAGRAGAVPASSEPLGCPTEAGPVVGAPASADASGAKTGARPANRAGAPAGVTSGAAPAASAGGRPAGRAGAQGPGGAGEPAPLRPGMFARVTTVFSINPEALVVPEEAIVPQGGRQFVIKVVEPSELPAPAVAASGAVAPPALPPDTKFVSLRQEVKLGARRQGKVQVLDGLSEGQTVVIAGQQRLQRDGTALRIIELGRPPQGAASAASAAAASAPAAAPPASAASR
jgi:membrane fusion protein (multidrug efflux system)